MNKDLRVTIDATPAVQGHAGIGRYVQELLNGLRATGRSGQVTAFSVAKGGGRPGGDLPNVEVRALRLGNKPWRFFVLVTHVLHMSTGRLCSPSSRIFHATDHLLPYRAAMGMVFTLHDLTVALFPDTHSPLNRWFSRAMVPRFMRHAHAVIAVSDSTKRDAMRIASIPAGKITVIPHGVNRLFCPRSDADCLAVRARYGLPGRFLLAVGTIEPRKNLTMLLDVMKALCDQGLDIPLVVAGRKGWLSGPFFDRMCDMGLEGRIVFTGPLADDDLAALYSAADLFVFPSLYEGFGLPVLEAMACGTPVVCSKRSSLPEVAGDAAILLPPDDPSAWVEAVKAVTANAELRKDLTAKGLQRSRGFTWERTAERTWQVYESVYEHCC